MLKFEGSKNLRRIVVLNPKGGSGKTTLAFNIAGYLASTGRKVALVDMDELESSARWIQNRSEDLPPVHLIKDTYRGIDDSEGDQRVAIPKDIDYIVVDSPAALKARELADFTCGAHAILLPVLPSDIDIHAASSLIADLLLVAIVSRRKGRLGVVANRVNERALAYRQLRRFLDSLSIAVVGVLRQSQNYVKAAAQGRCIHDLPPSRVRKDLEQWEAVTRWLDERLEMPLTPRDFLRPAATPAQPETSKLRISREHLAAAAAVGAVAMTAGVWLWSAVGMTNVEAVSQQVAETGTAEEALSPSESVPAQPLLAEARLEEIDVRVEPIPVEERDPGDVFVEKWELSGIASADGASIVILNDRHQNTTLSVGKNTQFDGWTVTDAGSDYAVFAHKGQVVRLTLNQQERRQALQDN